MRLVDASLPLKVVYSICHHEYLGYLITSHVVQILASGELSLVHQRIHSGNIELFEDLIDDIDRELIQLTTELLPRVIIKKFGGSLKGEVDFFTTRFNGEIKKLAGSYVQRRVSKILPNLIEKGIFIMGNDGYPAQKPVEVLAEEGTVLFHFVTDRDDPQSNSVRYFPTIKLNGEKINFQNKRAAMVCLEPAWMLLEGKLFTFERKVDGKKIRPFLTKYNIKIPSDRKEEYFRKFVPQILEKYHVHSTVFGVETISDEPRFSLVVEEQSDTSFKFSRRVSYDRFSFPLNEAGGIKAILEKNDQEYTFFRVKRVCEKENKILDFFEEIQPNPNSITPWEYVEKDKGLSWLSNNTERLENNGISIVQGDNDYQINLTRPEIQLVTEENGDWFDIKALVRIGEFTIPFIKFRNYILQNRREYKLPDGTIAILPEDWFSDYRHLLEVSEEQPEDETLRIRKYQAPLLNFPSKVNGRVKLIESIKSFDSIPQVSLPKGLKAELRNYQEQGVNWLHFLKDQGIGGILADDMGLGKTIQILALLQKEIELGVDAPSLVVVPTSLIYNWRNEAKKFTPDLQVHIHTGVNRSKDVSQFEGKNIILTSYGIVRQDISVLKHFPFHYVILDESQMIKNAESKTAKAIRKLISRHRVSLTGTPIENSVMDIWSQMSFLNPGLLGNVPFFKKFYVQPIEKEGDVKRSAKLKRIIYPFILRRKKQQVESELPPRIEKIHFCGMAEAQKEFYEETRNAYRNYLMELINTGVWKKNKLNILTGLQKLRQIAIHPQMIEKDQFKLKDSGKYLEIKRMLHKVIGNKKRRSKVLIFSQFVKMLHLLRDDLDAEGIKYNYLDGSTRDRQDQVDSFQEDKNIQVFLISLKAGGVGLNLTAADYVFILDPWWNPAVENQAIDRSHRIGQKRTVFYYKFITEESIEEKILSLQRKKSQLSDDIITVEDDIYKSLDAVDMEALFH